MAQDCSTGCGRPVEDAPCCTGCADALRVDLAALADHLVDELDTTLTRQARIGTRSGSRATERPLPFHLAASDVVWALQNTLGTTIRVLLENRPAESHGDGLPRPRRGDRYPLNSPASMALWLRDHVEDIRHHEAAGELVDELRAIVDQVRRVIDRPADRWYAGRCDCGADMYVEQGSPTFTCPECAAAYVADSRREQLRQDASDTLATATEIAGALTTLGRSVTAASIRGYAHRGRLEQRGEMPDPRREDVRLPLYRFGDVVDLLSRARAAS